MHIIDVEQSAQQMRKGLDMITEIVLAGGTVLFLNTRRQFEQATRRAATASGSYFVTKKWLGGTLTNSMNLLSSTVKPDLIICMSMPILGSVVKEANQSLVPTIGIVDTDCDPTGLTLAIPGNDDSEESIKLYLYLMNKAVIDAKAQRVINRANAPADLRGGAFTKDWTCPSCGASCYASRKECFKCGTVRGAETQYL